MNIDEYIEKSSQKIGGKKRRLEFQREIRSHLEDRIEFYTAAGWDRETAIQKTLDRMGDPKTVGDSMGRVHNNTASVVFDVIFTVLCIPLAYILFFALIISSTGDGYSNICYSDYIWELFLVFIIPAFMLFANRKGRHKTVMWIFYLFSTGYMVFRMIENHFCSYNLFLLYFIASGHRTELDLIKYSYMRYNGITLTVISIVIILAFWSAETAILVNSYYADGHTDKGAVKRRTVYRKFFSVIFAVAVSFNAVSHIAGFNADPFAIWKEGEEDEFYAYSGIYVISSDEIKDFDELNYNEYEFISFDYDFVPGTGYAFWEKTYEDWVLEKREFPNHGEINIEWIYQQSEVKNFEYAIQNVETTYKPSARYVAIVPFDDDRDGVYNRYDYSAAKWFDTQKVDELYGVLICFGIPELAYRISIK